MKVYGNLDIRGSDIIEGNTIQKNIISVLDDTVRDNIPNPSNGYIVVTLNDHKINIYKMGIGWIKIIPFQPNLKTIIISEEQSVNMSSEGNFGTSSIYIAEYNDVLIQEFILPSIQSNLNYVIIKRKINPLKFIFDQSTLIDQNQSYINPIVTVTSTDINKPINIFSDDNFWYIDSTLEYQISL